MIRQAAFVQFITPVQIMFFLKTASLTAFSAFTNVHIASAATQPVLEQRQNSFNAIQNWANDFADVDFRNNAGGNFNVTWDNGFAGNFVVGKGYRPGRDMSVRRYP
jgi:endo-1,4-beta-xylanase